jgi:hypothetical protein
MKNICKFVVLLGALALGTTIAAAASTESIRVNVPFAFVVAGKLFPAGQYNVQQSDSGLILVQGEGKSAVALTIPADRVKSDVPALHFSATNGREYLVSVDNNWNSRAVPLHIYEPRTLTLSH